MGRGSDRHIDLNSSREEGYRIIKHDSDSESESAPELFGIVKELAVKPDID